MVWRGGARREIYEFLNTVGHRSALRATISGHADDNKCDAINFHDTTDTRTNTISLRIVNTCMRSICVTRSARKSHFAAQRTTKLQLGHHKINNETT